MILNVATSPKVKCVNPIEINVFSVF